MTAHFTVGKPDWDNILEEALGNEGVEVEEVIRGDDPTIWDDLPGWSFNIMFPGMSVTSGHVYYVTSDGSKARHVMNKLRINYFDIDAEKIVSHKGCGLLITLAIGLVLLWI